jgi:hypothetical protein
MQYLLKIDPLTRRFFICGRFQNRLIHSKQSIYSVWRQYFYILISNYYFEVRPQSVLKTIIFLKLVLFSSSDKETYSLVPSVDLVSNYDSSSF